MKATGIVRRIDELGRIVVPKEIRRTLRIREGDPLEIFTDHNGGIILRKYSPVGELSGFAKEFAESLHATLGHTALVCDREAVIAISGGSKKEYVDKSLSPLMEEAVLGRKALVLNRLDGDALRPVIVGDSVDPYSAQVVAPIIAECEPVGAVVLLSREASTRMGMTEQKAAETAAGFIGRQLEQ